MTKASYDVAIVGAGPNGLTAAVLLGLAGLSVVVLERNPRIGGSCRTESSTELRESRISHTDPLSAADFADWRNLGISLL